MQDKRPVNLALHTISFPIAALASIAHRVSGIVLFIGSGMFIALVGYALVSEAQFEQTQAWLVMPWTKIGVFLILVAWVYHSLAGVRHLLMDIGWGENLRSGRASAFIVFLLTALSIVPLRAWLW